jgi:AbrB family looped-hinge helix DNA binding protein
MTTVLISPKFQVVIPKEVREEAGLAPGMKVEVIPYGDRIVLIPLKPLSALKGSLKGIDTTITRDKDRI